MTNHKLNEEMKMSIKGKWSAVKKKTSAAFNSTAGQTGAVGGAVACIAISATVAGAGPFVAVPACLFGAAAVLSKGPSLGALWRKNRAAKKASSTKKPSSGKKLRL